MSHLYQRRLSLYVFIYFVYFTNALYAMNLDSMRAAAAASSEEASKAHAPWVTENRKSTPAQSPSHTTSAPSPAPTTPAQSPYFPTHAKDTHDIDAEIEVYLPTIDANSRLTLSSQMRKIVHTLKNWEAIKRDHPLMPLSGGMILHGPPATGKTALAQAIAAETSRHFIPIKIGKLINSFKASGANNMERIFELAIGKAHIIMRDHSHSTSGVVIFFDEIDGVVSEKNRSKDGEETRIMYVLHQFLDRLSTDTLNGSIFFICATNDLTSIPEPLLTRFDIVELKHPTARQRSNFFDTYQQDATLAHLLEHSHNHLVQLTEGRNYRDLQRIVRDSIINIKESESAELDDFYSALHVQTETPINDPTLRLAVLKRFLREHMIALLRDKQVDQRFDATRFFTECAVLVAEDELDCQWWLDRQRTEAEFKQIFVQSEHFLSYFAELIRDWSGAKIAQFIDAAADDFAYKSSQNILCQNHLLLAYAQIEQDHPLDAQTRYAVLKHQLKTILSEKDLITEQANLRALQDQSETNYDKDNAALLKNRQDHWRAIYDTDRKELAARLSDVKAEYECERYVRFLLDSPEFNRRQQRLNDICILLHCINPERHRLPSAYQKKRYADFYETLMSRTKDMSYKSIKLMFVNLKNLITWHQPPTTDSYFLKFSFEDYLCISSIFADDLKKPLQAKQRTLLLNYYFLQDATFARPYLCKNQSDHYLQYLHNVISPSTLDYIVRNTHDFTAEQITCLFVAAKKNADRSCDGHVREVITDYDLLAGFYQVAFYKRTHQEMLDYDELKKREARHRQLIPFMLRALPSISLNLNAPGFTTSTNNSACGQQSAFSTSVSLSISIGDSLARCYEFFDFIMSDPDEYERFYHTPEGNKWRTPEFISAVLKYYLDKVDHNVSKTYISEFGRWFYEFAEIQPQSIRILVRDAFLNEDSSVLTTRTLKDTFGSKHVSLFSPGILMSEIKRTAAVLKDAVSEKFSSR